MNAVPPFVRRFVAGTTWQDVVPHCESLAAQGIRTTVNILGEDYRGEQASRAVQREYLDLVTQMDGSNSYLSIKLTMLGLTQSEELTCELLDDLLQAAAARGVFVRIDMEGSAWTEQTVAIYARMKKKYPALGIVLQAYLKRTRADLERLKAVDAKVRSVQRRLQGVGRNCIAGHAQLFVRTTLNWPRYCCAISAIRPLRHTTTC